MKRTTSGSAGQGAGAEGKKSFEAMMERLEELVAKLEGGNLSLDDSIKSFEEGMGLVKQCSSVLQEAEQRIQKLTRDAEGKPAVEGATSARRTEEDTEGELPF